MFPTVPESFPQEHAGESASGMFIRHLCSFKLEWLVISLLKHLSTFELREEQIDFVDTVAITL